MQTTLETTSGLERKLHITVPADELETQVEAKLKQTAGQVRIKGFRPGKVPLREVRRRFGDGIRQEVGSELMQSKFAEAIRQEEVSPAGMPQIENVTLESGKDLQFTAVFEVFPEITLADFGGINIERPVAEVTDADIDKMIETLRDQRKEFESVDRAAATGDKLNIDFEGFDGDEAFEGGKAEGAELELGAGQMIPGFEDGLLGVTKGQDTEFNVTFPDDYQAEHLAGKEVTFKVHVNDVTAAKLPEIDDEFFKQFGVEEGGLEAFRTEVRSNMEKELGSAVDNKVRTQVMDGLLEINEVDVPQSLLDQEIDRMRHDAIHQFGGHDKIDPSVLPAEMFSEQARRRVSLGLIVNAIVEQNEIKLDDERVKAKIEDMASSYEEPDQVVQYYYGNEDALSQVQNLVMEEQVVDRILAEAKVTEKNVPYDEAVKPAEQAAAGADEAAAEADEEAADDAEAKD